MTHNDLFPEPQEPKIYAYFLPEVKSHEGFIKIGYTTRSPEIRIREQTKILGVKPVTLLTFSAIRNDGTVFSDKDVHAVLEHNGFIRHPEGHEWFRCSRNDVIRAVEAVRNHSSVLTERVNNFTMRPEQKKAVEITSEYFKRPGNQRKFLWNAKMRFGKTFAAYQLCKRLAFTKILVVTFKPAVESAWSDDIFTHKDFEGWQFISNHTAKVKNIQIDDEFANSDKKKPLVVFGSFQDLLGTNDSGGIKAKNEFIHETHWDIVIFDEYHFGAWRERARGMFNEEGLAYEEEVSHDEACTDEILPITADYRLYLSGTPFRALNSGEFIEEQIYSWTYSDEQRAKIKWEGSGNPYSAMPRMVMMTYQIPESIRRIAEKGEFDGFDLNEFFAADNNGFKHAEEVCKWLKLIRGAYLPFEEDCLKLGRENRPPLPYSDSRLLKTLRHTVWFLPDVASCRAMYNALKDDEFFGDYKIVLCAGDACGCGIDALAPVHEAMTDNPLKTKTITLTCGKLLSGVTVKAWAGIFMLCNLRSPETYFQAAFRVQSPFTAEDAEGNQIILKSECYVFDFALDRALKQIADYSCRLNIDETDPEKKAEEFMNFLPVLAFDGATMTEISAGEVLDYALSGTSGVLLARRWKSALLVNLNTETLTRLLNDKIAMKAVEKITAFRALGDDIQTIINKTNEITRNRGSGDSTKKREISAAEKERRKRLKEIREKLIKFLTRIPVFMYLTDDREKTLKDIICEINPILFRSVTGITIQEFELLNRLEVFNAELINDAIYKFKCYEDSSLNYTGLEFNETQIFGLYDRKITREEIYEE